jgi:hypothetical protein
MKEIVKKINEDAVLYRDNKTGIAWIDSSFCGLISVHSNIQSSGSIRGMKDRGYWGRKDRCLRTNGFIYNIDRFVFYSDIPGTPVYEYEHIVAENCNCPACIERRARKGEAV